MAHELNISIPRLRNWRDEINPTFTRRRPSRTHFQKLSKEQKAAVERQIIEMFCAGHTTKEISEKLVDISASGVSRRIKLYKDTHPLPGNRPYPRRRSRSFEPCPPPKEKMGIFLLPEVERNKMQSDLIKRRPEELCNGKYLWDRDSLCAWLAQKYTFDRHTNASFRALLHRLGIATSYSLWEPLKVASPSQKKDYKTLYKEAEKAKMPIVLVTLAQTQSVPGGAGSVNWWMISATSGQAKSRHLGILFFKEEPAALQWIEFFERLSAFCGKKGYVILDHKLSILQRAWFSDWLRKNSEGFEVFVMSADGITQYKDAFQEKT